MERIKALIDKLHQQKEQGFTPAQLLPTVQLLQSELMQYQQKTTSLGTSKVAVMMPAQLHPTQLHNAEELTVPAALVEDKKPKFQAREILNENIQPETNPPVAEPVKEPEYFLHRPLVEEDTKKEERLQPAASQTSLYAGFDSFGEAPTLAQHQPKEVHEVLANSKESLNDRLKQQRTELAHALKDSPIKDLRKGIGINDRFTFVSELFRGDDAMYERSIKTINNFRILSEAEYWINRELKFKLGWNDNKEIVQHFYQLVRRRFA